MLDKIEPKLLENVSILEDNNEIECLIKVRSAKDLAYISTCKDLKDIIKLPFINTVAVKINKDKIYKIASKNFVKYISSNTKVFAQVNVARKIVGVHDFKPTDFSDFTCAVIDTGLYPHLDFIIDNKRIVAFKDFVNDFEVLYDDNGHGTVVAGVLAGSGLVSGAKYAGIDSKLKLVVIKALDSSGETGAVTILKAMQWILDNKEKYKIKIVCMSFGSNVLEKNDPLILGAEILWNNGIIVVTACGNSGPDSQSIKSPSASAKVISVGALNDKRNNLDQYNISRFSVADFSSRGPVFNAYKPDVLASGVNIRSCCNFNLTKQFYAITSGTSVATPIVAGVCSLLLRKYPHLTPNEVKKILIQNCNKITGDRNSEGHGWLNVENIFKEK